MKFRKQAIPVRTEARALAVAVLTACQQAGRPELASGFVRRGISVAQAKSELSALNAEAWRKAHIAAKNEPTERIVVP